MRIDIAITNAVIRGLLRILCKLDIAELRRLPKRGPAIFVMNHTNFIEAPILAAFLADSKLAALTKKELSTSRGFGYFASIWNAIPIDRGSVDAEAFNACLAWVKDGGILGLAPEGTRSKTGILQQGKAGVAVLAHRAGVPVWPIALSGSENFWKNFKSFKRTPIKATIGEPFMIEPVGSMTKTVRQEVADEIMRSIAKLLPERYRGTYADTATIKPRHLRLLQSDTIHHSV